MIQKIFVSVQPPRAMRQYSGSIKIFKGLIAYFGFGIFVLTSVLFLIILNFFNAGKDVVLEEIIRIILPLIIFDAIGALLLFYGVREKQKRYLSFTQGIFIKGTVTGSGKKFVFWKSSRINTVTIEVILPSGKSKQQILNLCSPEIQQELFIGKEINGLFDEKSGSLFFPQEIGVDIVAE